MGKLRCAGRRRTPSPSSSERNVSPFPRRQRSLRRREKHEHRQVLRDVEEAMLDGTLDNKQRSRRPRLHFGTRSEASFPAHDVVPLILRVRLLWILRLSRLQTIDPHAECREAEKLGPRPLRCFACLDELTESES